MEALSHLESLVTIGLTAAAVLLALGSAFRSLRPSPGQPPTGELAWTLVAILVLGVVAAVAGGGPDARQAAEAHAAAPGAGRGV